MQGPIYRHGIFDSTLSLLLEVYGIGCAALIIVRSATTNLVRAFITIFTFLLAVCSLGGFRQTDHLVGTFW